VTLHQRGEGIKTARDVRLHGALADAHRLGHLGLGQVQPVAQHQGLPVAGRELPERVEQVAVALPAYDVVLGTRDVRRRVRCEPPDDGQVAQPGPGQVDHRGAQVGDRCVRVAQRAGAPVQPDEGLLGHVLGIVGAEHRREPGHRRELAVEQLLVAVPVHPGILPVGNALALHIAKTREPPRG